jgi:hypothetical protein
VHSLASLDFHSALLLFWCVILFDIPRYFVSTMVLAFMPPDKLPSRRYSTSALDFSAQTNAPPDRKGAPAAQ